MPISIDKRDKLYSNLNGSKFINTYIDNNVYLSWFQGMSDDLKFIACYGYNYLDALKN